MGPYEILLPLGAGGMGEVYRARDSKLNRDVAIKVLSAPLANDADYMARFQREAQILASLNHPNIAVIYGLEDRGIIMELVQGFTLSERIAQGSLAPEEALAIATQVTEGLEAAHEKGIVHRDLKPGNIMITGDGRVKILDFGLAAIAQQASAKSDPETSPTLTVSATPAGMILGTAAYMSPEQARGKPVDKRADIWAFGCVFYEMLTGAKPFSGEDVAEIVGAVIHKEPELARVPSQFRDLIERCLRKDPRRRMRDIGDVRLALEEPPGVNGNTPTLTRPILPWAAAALLAIALLISLLVLRPRPADLPMMRLPVELGPSAFLEGPATNNQTFAISPDGSRLVYGARGADGQKRLAIRKLDQAHPVLLAGSEGGLIPFFSPDGHWIGFTAGGKLKKIPVEGGAVTVLCDSPNPRGAAWTEGGYIIASLDTHSPLMRVPETGGSPTPLLDLDNNSGESTQRWPQILPGGKTLIFTSHTSTGNYENAAIVAQSLTGGKRKLLWKGGSYGRYAPPGYLLFVHSGSLFAARMNADQLSLSGQPLPVVEGIAMNAVSGGGGYDFAPNGLLVFQSGESLHQESIYWISSAGPSQLVATFPGAFAMRLAPDGQRIALSADQGSGQDIWIYDLQRATRTRLTFGGSNINPIWTPDGKDVVYVSVLPGSNELRSIRSDGTGEPNRLYSSPMGIQTSSISPDGKHLLFAVQAAGTGGDVFAMPLERTAAAALTGGPVEPFVKTAFNERHPEFSPDGRWVAYASDETGRYEVYVRPFPGSGGRWQISNSGGALPVWSRKGSELYYLESDHMMVVAYRSTRDSFAAEKPRMWTDHFVNPSAYRRFDLSSDGKRFLQLKPLTSADDKSPTELTFVLNFFDELRRRVPSVGK